MRPNSGMQNVGTIYTFIMFFICPHFNTGRAMPVGQLTKIHVGDCCCIEVFDTG